MHKEKLEKTHREFSTQAKKRPKTDTSLPTSEAYCDSAKCCQEKLRGKRRGVRASPRANLLSILLVLAASTLRVLGDNECLQDGFLIGSEGEDKL